MMKNNINFIVRITNEGENANIISIYLIDDSGKSFYAEFNDFNEDLCSNYIMITFVNKLKFNHINEYINEDDPYISVYKSDYKTISIKLYNWLKQFDDISFSGNKETFCWYHFLRILSKQK